MPPDPFILPTPKAMIPCSLCPGVCQFGLRWCHQALLQGHHPSFHSESAAGLLVLFCLLPQESGRNFQKAPYSQMPVLGNYVSYHRPLCLNLSRCDHPLITATSSQDRSLFPNMSLPQRRQDQAPHPQLWCCT